MINKCKAPPFQKVLCNDGLGCYCDVMSGITPPKEPPVVQSCPKCDRLAAWDRDGAINERGMALFFLEKLLDAEREIKKLRGSGMCGCGDSRSRDESHAAEELWSI